jgi:hypothetical protein
MSFDRTARNALSRAVAQIRERLKTDVMDQLRRLGFQADGTVLDLARIEGLSERDRVAGEELRALLDHLIAGERGPERGRRRSAYNRLAREIGFTTLNRLVAIRMAEERGLVVPAVGGGFASTGFQLYERVANGALGGRAETYRAFLEFLYDELAVDLPLLFDRTDPHSWVFPSERCLEDLFALLNAPDIAPLWCEDEAIGWVYQYFNDPDERRDMRRHGAPRTSRELAVRNQFFTPRYVVEFLTGNTLGRIWYEMRQGETGLTDECRYLVRRKHPIWLGPDERAPEPFPVNGDSSWRPSCPVDEIGMWVRPNPEITAWQPLAAYALTVEGYEALPGRNDSLTLSEFFGERYATYEKTGKWEGTFEELRACLYMAQRIIRHTETEVAEGKQLDACLALNRALCDRWDLEVDAISYRPKKDPRAFRILDPACGSGHFLLYAFDLLLTIYDEAWDDADLGPALHREYGDREYFTRQIPALILHHNLHGIDIDPRACQIAALALWLRAQRYWQQLGLAPADRPLIRKSNIVCAEPMPGEQELLHEYLRSVDPRLRDLVQAIWEQMQLAGESGSLLKIEEEIKGELETARRESLVPNQEYQITLYGVDQPPRQTQMPLANKDDIAFWRDAEQKLLDALRDYAEQASDGRAVQRRLFAGDAAQGFAFIDLCRQVFDVVLMNPPFGEPSASSKPSITAAYPRTKNDLYAAFVERWLHRLVRGGQLGAITSRTGFFLTSFQKWREEILLTEARPTVMADLGFGVLDAMVETAAYCLERADRIVVGHD